MGADTMGDVAVGVGTAGKTFATSVVAARVVVASVSSAGRGVVWVCSVERSRGCGCCKGIAWSCVATGSAARGREGTAAVDGGVAREPRRLEAPKGGLDGLGRAATTGATEAIGAGAAEGDGATVAGTVAKGVGTVASAAVEVEVAVAVVTETPP